MTAIDPAARVSTCTNSRDVRSELVAGANFDSSYGTVMWTKSVAADWSLVFLQLLPKAQHLPRVLIVGDDVVLRASSAHELIVIDVLDCASLSSMVFVDPNAHRHVLQLEELQELMTVK